MSFAPDVIVSEHGCDTHAWDPLTHLSLTMRGIQAQIRLAHEFAHTYCHGRWVALGGGGYDLYRVVPRAWTMLWAEMSKQPLPERLPEVWIERWRPAWLAMEQPEEMAKQLLGKAPGQADFPATFQDEPGDFPAQPRRWSIAHTNRRTAALVRQLLLPHTVRRPSLPGSDYHRWQKSLTCYTSAALRPLRAARRLRPPRHAAAARSLWPIRPVEISSVK